MSFLDNLDNADFSTLPSVAPDFSFDPSMFDIPGGFPDLGAVTVPVLPPVLNLPTTGNVGISGLLKDITGLVSNVYAGEAQVANAQAGYKMTQAQNALALRNVKQAPTMWTVLALGGAALLAVVLVEKSGK